MASGRCLAYYGALYGGARCSAWYFIVYLTHRESYDQQT